MSDRIRAVSEDVLLRQGLPQAEAGRVLRKALRDEFGLGKGRSIFAPSVPAKYAGNPDLYFRGVAATASHQSRTFGKMHAFQEAEIISYRLENPQDRRTGAICSQLAGQVFTVQSGVSHMNRVLDAEDPTDVKNIAPWLSGEQISQTLGGARIGSGDASDRLAAAGVVLPPFHQMCRTEPVVLN
jgi:hypothetical protein